MSLSVGSKMTNYCLNLNSSNNLKRENSLNSKKPAAFDTVNFGLKSSLVLNCEDRFLVKNKKTFGKIFKSVKKFFAEDMF